MYLFGFLLVLGPLITIHELGHYMVGRWFGVKAEAFSIGFGKEIVGWTDRYGTRWKIAILPLGGYVQFYGDMNPSSVGSGGASDSPHTFQSKSLLKRSLIVFAGPATNLFVTIAIFFVFFAVNGQPKIIFPEDSTTVSRFAPESSARDAGMEIGDRILAVDGKTVNDFQELIDKVALYPNKEIRVTVERAEIERQLLVTIGSVTEKDRFGNEMTVGRLGIFRPETGDVTVSYQRESIFGALAHSVQHTWETFKMMMLGLKQIIIGDRSFQELGGPLKIAKYSGEQLSLGVLAFVNFVALISLNLAFINLLPIPGLDGGHLLFYAAEAVRRRPLGENFTGVAYRLGLGSVLMLFLVVTLNDLLSLPIFRS